MSSSFAIEGGGQSRCTNCGASAAGATPDGLCSACLLAMALRTLQSGGESEAELESPSDLLRGRDFAGYELLAELGRGGMGVVFKARQKHPDRFVALKVISMGELASPRMVQRFQFEAKAAAKLSHPGIAAVYEVGKERGWHFYSMQWIDGGTLAQVAETPWRNDFRRLARVIGRVAQAVHYAHQHGILHRDLKPTNVLINKSGEPFLTDFGLAKMIEDDSDGTLTRAILGTPSYMSPEQTRGGSEDVSVTTDVYGLGAILYELIAGRPPFSASSPAVLLRKICEDEPERPSVMAGRQQPPRSVPRDLESICLKALEKDPRRRYASAADMADDVERWLRGEPIHARPCGSLERLVKWTRRKPATAGLVATAGLTALILIFSFVVFNVRLQRARRNAEQSAALARAELVRHHLHEASRLNEEGDSFIGALSAVEALRQATSEAERRSALDRLNLVFFLSPRLAGVWDDGSTPTNLCFSEDGHVLRSISVIGSTNFWSVAGQSPAKMNGSFPARNGQRTNAISPDGTLLARARGDYTVQICRTSDLRQTAPLLHHNATISVLAWSKDGRFLAAASKDHLVKIWDFKNDALHRLALPLPVCRPMFSPEGSRFMAREGGGLFRLHDAGTGVATGPVMDAGAPVGTAIWDRSGRYLATGSQGGLFHVWDLASNTILLTIPLGGGWISADFSPDSSRLVVAGGLGDLFFWKLPSAEPYARTSTGYSIRRVEWSGDGRWCLTASDDGIRLWDAQTGSQVGRKILIGPKAHTARFSPDSSLIIASFEQGISEPSVACLWSVPSLTRVGAPLEHGDSVYDVRFSPDGRFVLTSGADAAICAWFTSTGQPVVPRMRQDDPVMNVAYSPESRWLLSSGEGGTVRFWESQTGELLGPPLVLPFRVLDTALSPFQTMLVRVADGPGFFIRLEFAQRTDAEFADLAALYSGLRRDASGGLSPIPPTILVRQFSQFAQKHPAGF